MLQIEHLTYSYAPIREGDSRIIALHDVSLHVAAGECVTVTGANGSGKTTLCLAAAGLAPRLTEGRIESGSILVDKRDVQAETAGALADVIGVVMQDPSGQLFNPTVADEIAWGLENLGVPPDEMDARIRAALGWVGLGHLGWERQPQTLSGGEQRRLALASVLVMRPKVLILDEPSGGLSPDARQDMIRVLRDLRKEQSLAILFTESDAEVIAALADRVVELADAEPIRSRIQTIKAGLVRCEASAPAPTGQPAIELQNVSFAYDEARPVLRGIDLQVGRGEFVALLGDNGAGKTTLARQLIGLLRPTSGSVRVMGQDTAGMGIGQIARWVGFAFQNPELQIFNPTVKEEIAFGARNLGMSDQEIDAAVGEAMARFGLTEIAKQPPAALSFSVRRKVALASIAAMHTPILVLDEPTVGLDAAGRALMMDWLDEQHQAGTTILLITHDLQLASRAERRIMMANGQIGAAGDATAAPIPNVVVPVKPQSWLYRLDPRVKLWFALLGFGLIFVTLDWRVLLGVLISANVVLLGGGVPVRQVIGLWRGLLPVALIILILQPLFSQQGAVIWQLGPVAITVGGVLLAVSYALRLLGAAFIATVPIATTSMNGLVRGMVKVGMPYSLGMTIGLALHYLETIGGLYRQIEEAQQARGWDLSQGRLWKRVRAAVPTLIAVIIASLRLSDSLALGLAARGFSLGRARTVRRDIRMTGIDWAVMGGITAATLLVLWIALL